MLAALLAALALSSSAIGAHPPQQMGAGAFYYVWYGEPRVDGAYMHWNHSILPHWNENVRSKHAGSFKYFFVGF